MGIYIKEYGYGNPFAVDFPSVWILTLHLNLKTSARVRKPVTLPNTISMMCRMVMVFAKHGSVSSCCSRHLEDSAAIPLNP